MIELEGTSWGIGRLSVEELLIPNFWIFTLTSWRVVLRYIVYIAIYGVVWII